jgi:hypothetical protein
MLDTLKLSLTEFSVSSDAQLQVQPPTWCPATGERPNNYKLWNSDAGIVEGTRAWHNGEFVNLDIKPDTHNVGGPSRCLVQFSVPKVATGSNYHPTDHKGTAEALCSVQKYLQTIGVYAELSEAHVSRADVFKVAECEEAFEAYHPVLSMLQGQRMRKRDYGTTFLFENTVQEICVYDKLEEMRRNKRSIEGLPLNSMRFEMRALKGQKVRSWLGISTAAELVSNLDHVQAQYRVAMEKQLFKAELSERSRLTRGQVAAQMQAAQETCGRYWFDAWLRSVAINSMSDDLDAVRAAIVDVTGSRKNGYKFLSKLEAAKLDATAMKVLGSSKRPLGELYSELREKVLA